MFSFDVLAQDSGSAARTGVLRTPHGTIHTPAFVPVGTAGTVKGITPEQLRTTGAQIMLCNTYHLALRPTADVVARLGGLHRFTGWDGPILTDSGGFQVFSLAEFARADDDGLHFKSHLDGSMVSLTPETAIDIQEKLGADIIMPLDQCPPLPSPPEVIKVAVDRTIAWARRCQQAHQRADQALYGIIQGGLDADLRRSCADALLALDFVGYAVGGLSVGESHGQMMTCLEAVQPLLPPDRPRHLLGVGMPWDLVAAVRRGMDTFDCVLPTRNGRRAYAFTPTGGIKLRNAALKHADVPLDATCDCYACTHFSAGYIRHLFIAGEMLGPILASLHNLRFFQRLMARIRDLLPDGKLETIHDEFPVTAVPPEGLEDQQQ